MPSEYKVVKMRKYYVITKDGQLCGDREIEMMNAFTWESEATEVCDNLNGREENEQ